MTNDYQHIMSQIFAYGEELREFVDDHALPEEWFARPDHIAYKCSDDAHYDEVLRQAMDDAESLSFVTMDNRRLASAKLEKPVYIESFGTVEWLEVMEPRPERIGNDVVGLEHMEFYWSDFESAEEVLRDRGITFSLEGNPGQQWLSLVINDYGQEVKLSNETLAAIVQQDIEDGTAEVIL